MNLFHRIARPSAPPVDPTSIEPATDRPSLDRTRQWAALARRILPIAVLSLATQVAVAAQVGIDAFGSASRVDFDNLDASDSFSDHSSPFEDRGIVFSGSSDIRTFRSGIPVYSGGFCADGCVTDLDYPSTNFRVALATPSKLMGLYVGSFGAFTLGVTFYTAADVVLGTEAFAGNDDSQFAGFSSTSDIAYAVITAHDLRFASGVESVLFQGAPEPGSMALLFLGLAGLTAACRKRAPARRRPADPLRQSGTRTRPASSPITSN